MTVPSSRKKDFARQYVTLGDGVAAYRASYGSMLNGKPRDGQAVAAAASRLVRDPIVQGYIAEYQAKADHRFTVTADMVVELWWRIATADPNALILHRQVNCRYCHGFRNGYQWVDMDEWAAACAAALVMEQPPRDANGGVGFKRIREPHADCPRCNGDGVGDVLIADTVKAESPLYAGLKQTRDGIQILMRDQDAALANIARHLGMFNDRAPGSANGNPIPPAVTLTTKSAAEVAKVYKQLMGVAP